MSVYRMTKFTSSDFDKATEFLDSLREMVSGADAECIDVISLGDGKGVVIAKYETQAKMDAATHLNRQAFAKLVEAGLVDGNSIAGQTGEVAFSF